MKGAKHKTHCPIHHQLHKNLLARSLGAWNLPLAKLCMCCRMSVVHKRILARIRSLVYSMPLCLSYMITCLLQNYQAIDNDSYAYIMSISFHMIIWPAACIQCFSGSIGARSIHRLSIGSWRTENDILAYILLYADTYCWKWTPQSVPWLFAHTPPLNKWSPKCASSNSIRPCKQVNVFVSKCIGRLCSLCVCTFNTGAHRASLQYSIAWLVFPSLPSRCRFMKRRSKTTN